MYNTLYRKKEYIQISDNDQNNFLLLARNRSL